MEKVSQALYQALRDDSEATVGIRALLGNTTTSPYNVYHAFIPEAIDLKTAAGNVGFITYNLISSVAETDIGAPAVRLFQELYDFTVYHRLLTTVEAVHQRIKRRLISNRGVTQPTTLAAIYNLKLERLGPHRWDENFNVYFQVASYRAWVRDDDIH